MRQAKGRKVADILTRLLYGAFAVVFGWLLYNILFNNMHFPHLRPGWVLLATVAWCGLLYGVWRLVKLCAKRFSGREGLGLALYFILLAATQVLFYWQVGAFPSRDLDFAYTAAVNFSVNGFIEEPHLTYFYRFPNNMPLVILLQLVFRVMNRFGLERFYVGGTILNAAAIMAAHLFVYLCCKRLFGRTRAFYALAVLYLCLPLQCLVAQFYTDTLTMAFIPFGLYCYLRLRSAETLKGRLLAMAAMAGGLALGTKIKYSVVIVLVAILLDILLRRQWKQLVLAPAFLVLFAGVSAGFDAYMYAHFLDRETSADMATPFSAWIMMGLAGDGSHNAGDNYLVWAQDGAEEMDRVAREELARRLQAHTPWSFARFLNQKALRSFGSGNLDTARTVANAPLRQTFLVECVSPGGRYFTQYETVVQGYYLVLLLFTVAGAVMLCISGQTPLRPVYIALLGLLLFLLLWEADNRYLINYFTLFIVSGIGAFGQLQALLRGRGKEVAADAG